MTKFVLLCVIASFAVCVQGYPPFQAADGGVSAAAAAGKWDEVSRLLSQMISQRYDLRPLNQNFDVKNLQPARGGHVYGESNFEYHSASNVNGHKQEQSGGHKVINDDGKITEYNYKPKY